MGNKKLITIVGSGLVFLGLIYLLTYFSANKSEVRNIPNNSQPAAVAQVQDFAIDTSGPHHVVQGHYMFFNAKGRVITGADEYSVVPSISGLPTGATAEFVGLIRHCCGTFLYQLTGDNPIKISTSANTPIGTYTLSITYKTPGGLQRSVPYTLYVDPVPSLVKKPGNYYPADVPLASLDQWKSNMTTYGLKHCKAEEMFLWEGFVWYYDGARIYYQIADQTGDSSWNNCAQMVTNMYRQYVLVSGVTGWRVFPHGLAMNYERTGDQSSRQAVTALVKSSYADWPVTAWSIPWQTSREISYGIEANLVDQSLGGPVNPHFQDLVEILLGHFDQWFVSKNTSYTQPFMVALGAEALIQYWDVTHDPRIPPILQTAADQLWANTWDDACGCSRYYDEGSSGVVSSTYTDLNLLIAPLYGWVYQRTGAQIYRDQGDRIFNTGVAGAWLDGGKQFSQSYRWSGKYVEWRNLNGQISPAPVPPPVLPPPPPVLPPPPPIMPPTVVPPSINNPVNTLNQAPVVDAGVNKSATFPSAIQLNGNVTDDGLPTSSLVTVWTKVSGPGLVTFANPAQRATTAAFYQVGNYILRLTATDGVLSAFDEIAITINGQSGITPPPPPAPAPTVSLSIPAGSSVVGGSGLVTKLVATVTGSNISSVTFGIQSGPGVAAPIDMETITSPITSGRYEMTWQLNPAWTPVGSYQLYARVRTTSGSMVTSSPVSIKVTAPVSLIPPPAPILIPPPAPLPPFPKPPKPTFFIVRPG